MNQRSNKAEHLLSVLLVCGNFGMTISPDIGLVEEVPSNGHQDHLIYPVGLLLWRHLKSRVYATQPETLEVLRRRIVEECRLITPDVLSKVRTEIKIPF